MTATLQHGTPVLDRAQVLRALDVVIDPELDEPITDLGFVRSVAVSADGAVEVHLRLPTSFCSPNFAYLMASDAKDALVALNDGRPVLVELDDHHDSGIINAGLAADAGYKGTFLHEAEDDLEELRRTFRRKAHTAASERALTALLRARPDLTEVDVTRIRLRDVPEGPQREALVRRRRGVGLDDDPDLLVLVDHTGQGYAEADGPLRLRLARSTRISIDGNAHFCRGLLRTRYPGSEADQVNRPEGAEPADAAYDPTFVPVPTVPTRTHEEAPQ
ncbi:MAG: putative metal-sulfur cluster biosynthetic enzyme [Marmoricola sp.]|nr:putative metal-sulfur cluster biosynthetic enzyme [Marmoricola sp.]